MAQVDARTSSIGNDNVAAAATDRISSGSAELMPTASTERSLSQASGVSSTMRSTAQQALNASIAVGCGPDMYDGDGCY